MCAIYSLFALFWFVCSFCYWRDLLRIQIWIGGVILLGLMEKAAYLAEYDQINRNGYTCKVFWLSLSLLNAFTFLIYPSNVCSPSCYVGRWGHIVF